MCVCGGEGGGGVGVEGVLVWGERKEQSKIDKESEYVHIICCDICCK